MKKLEKVKRSLVKIANQNKKEDLESNIQYWNNVIIEIKKCDNEIKLLEIAELDFGFDSFEQVMESVKNYK
jgi:hypothetical protein